MEPVLTDFSFPLTPFSKLLWPIRCWTFNSKATSSLKCCLCLWVYFHVWCRWFLSVEKTTTKISVYYFKFVWIKIFCCEFFIYATRVIIKPTNPPETTNHTLLLFGAIYKNLLAVPAQQIHYNKFVQISAFLSLHFIVWSNIFYGFMVNIFNEKKTKNHPIPYFLHSWDHWIIRRTINKWSLFLKLLSYIRCTNQ